MIELVEAVARALGEKLNGQFMLTKAEQDEALDLARAALAAIEAEGFVVIRSTEVANPTHEFFNCFYENARKP